MSRAADERAYSEAQKQAHGLELPMLHCRAKQHDPMPRHAVRLRGGGWEIEEVCAHGCGVSWVRLLDKWGFIIDTHPRYPKGYLFKNVGRARGQVKAASRIEFMARNIKVVTRPRVPKR